jgi:predicted RNA binding protein YcfA (HicA-like mRNA interferase family)
MSYQSDVLKVIKRATAQGWRYAMTRGGHHQFFAPPPKHDIVVASGTSCNHTGWRRFLADMRRAGYRADPVMPSGGSRP